MLKYSEFPPRNLMKFFLIKNLSPTKPDWDVLEKAVQLSMSPRK